jgi:hypothetical protein
MPDNRWRLRVVKHELVDPRTLIAHPDNWRAHPDAQKDVMAGAISEIGFVGEVLVSQLSGRILDGHMRVALAIRDKQDAVPVGWVDCVDEAEENRILGSYDPIGTLAQLDAERYERVLANARIADQPLREMLEAMIPAPPPPPPSDDDEERPDTSAVEIPEVWGVAVECTDEQQQIEVLELLTERGYTARALLS